MIDGKLVRYSNVTGETYNELQKQSIIGESLIVDISLNTRDTPETERTTLIKRMHGRQKPKTLTLKRKNHQ